jgi:dTMP kinase
MSDTTASRRGLFITIEGGEGVGKSTQMRLLAERLVASGAEVLVTREPGGTGVGDRIREMLLDPTSVIAPVTELLLYEASRAELVAQVIAPALERGEIVICDRFFDSSTAYQAYGRGLDLEMVQRLNLAATGGLVPDITVLLAMDLTEAMARATQGGADRIEAATGGFHERVVAGFASLAAAEPQRWLAIDAAGGPEQVAERVWSAVSAHPAFARALGGTSHE